MDKAASRYFNKKRRTSRSFTKFIAIKLDDAFPIRVPAILKAVLTKSNKSIFNLLITKLIRSSTYTIINLMSDIITFDNLANML